MHNFEIETKRLTDFKIFHECQSGKCARIFLAHFTLTVLNKMLCNLLPLDVIFGK